MTETDGDSETERERPVQFHEYSERKWEAMKEPMIQEGRRVVSVTI